MFPKKLRVLALLGAAATLGGQNLKEFEKHVTEFTLSNGMKFIVLERHEAPVVAFNAYVNAGSANDPAGKASTAHMFEHMIGKGIRSVGSKNWPEEQKALQRVEDVYDRLDAARKKGDQAASKQAEAELKDAVESANSYVEPNAYVRTIEEQGGVGFNAGTAHDSTTYFYSLPSNKLELWFLLSSEFFKHPVFREFYKERDVVLEERRMRVESNPQGKLLELFIQTAFPKHPYGEFTGSAESISALRAREAQKFFDTYYTPQNVTVAVVGDVGPSQVKQFAEKYFGSIPKRATPPPLNPAPIRQEKEKRVSMPSDSQPMVIIGYRRPDQRAKDDPVFDVLAGILASGRTGLLYKELVRDKKVALVAEAGATFPSGKLPNLFVFFGLPNAGHTTEEIEKGIHDILERLKREKVDQATLERVKTKVRAGLVRQLDSNSGLAQQLPYYEVNYDDWRMMFTGIQEIEKVTADDIQRVVREYFTPEHRTVAYTVPAEKQTKGAAK